jgi:hypothetical protein
MQFTYSFIYLQQTGFAFSLKSSEGSKHVYTTSKPYGPDKAKWSHCSSDTRGCCCGLWGEESFRAVREYTLTNTCAQYGISWFQHTVSYAYCTAEELINVYKTVNSALMIDQASSHLTKLLNDADSSNLTMYNDAV